MSKSLKAVVYVLALVCLAASGCVTASAQGGGQGPAPPTSLTGREQRGRAIYLRGEGVPGREITAAVSELDVPASTVTCAGCHGRRGEGKTEGGITAGSLIWSQLLKPDGHTHPTGRKHGPFTESSFTRAVAEGVDPAGNTMLTAMPHYRMSADDMADLIAYLKRIETDGDPGLTETAIEVGLILPTTGPVAETGSSMRAILAAFFDDLNARGGVHDRRIVLRDFASPAAAATTQTPVFAYVGGIVAGAEAELARLAREQEVPIVGPSTLMTDAGTPPNRHVFYLLPGMAEQARALANFAASGAESKKGRVAIVYGEGALAGAAAASAEEQLKKVGFETITRQTLKGLGGDGAAAARQLRQSGAEAVFIFGLGGGEGTLVKEAGALEWTPRLFMLGVMDGRDLLSTAPAAFKDRLFLAFPTVPSDVTPAGFAEFRSLIEKYRVTPRHTAAQL